MNDQLNEVFQGILNFYADEKLIADEHNKYCEKDCDM